MSAQPIRSIPRGSLARLAGLARTLEERSELCSTIGRLIETLRATGVVVEGEARHLDDCRRALGGAHDALAELADAGDRPAAARLLKRLDATLNGVIWEVAEETAGNLQQKAAAQDERLHKCRAQVKAWRGHLESLMKQLHQAQIVGAPVGSEGHAYRRLEAVVNSAERQLEDPRSGGPPLDLMDQLDAESERPRQLIEAIQHSAAQAARFNRKADLQLLKSPLDQRQRHVYTILLRTPSEPGSHGISIEGSSTLVKQDCDLMGATLDYVTEAIGQGLVRDFATRRGGGPAGGDVAGGGADTGAGGSRADDPGLKPPADPAMRRFGPPPMAAEGITCTSISERVQDMGDFMCRLVVPEQMQRYVTDPSSSLTITSNDLALPWELMSYRDQAGNVTSLCLEKPVARMPLGRAIPREGRSVRRPDVLRFLLVYADPHGTLPAARREIEQIKASLEVDWQDQIASKQLVIDVLDEASERRATGRRLNDELRSGRYDVVHYAGHADFDKDRPELSGLLLHSASCSTCASPAAAGAPGANGPAQHEDEVFFAQKIRRLLEGRPLVFLNACETGRSANEQEPQQVSYFQGPAEGLASAFIYGGALGCVGSLWPVYDDAAADFAVHFYGQVLREQTIGEAVRLARRHIRDKYADRPTQVTWASFVLYGDPTFRLVNVLRREQ